MFSSGLPIHLVPPSCVVSRSASVITLVSRSSHAAVTLVCSTRRFPEHHRCPANLPAAAAALAARCAVCSALASRSLWSTGYGVRGAGYGVPGAGYGQQYKCNNAGQCSPGGPRTSRAQASPGWPVARGPQHTAFTLFIWLRDKVLNCRMFLFWLFF